jgi:hypothetical protein
MDDLAGLADGTLTGRRRARAEQAVAGSPDLARLLAEQGRTLELIRAAAPEVPDALRMRIDAESATAARPPRVRRARRLLPVAVGMAVLAVVLLFARGGALVLEDAEALSQRSPEAAFVAPVEQSGLAFPDWAAEFGWKPAGVRTDDVDGRSTTTVFYDKNGARIGYTIVGGQALEGTPEQPTLRDGDGSRHVVIWQRDGHTCILSGPVTMKREVLLKLAAADA